MLMPSLFDEFFDDFPRPVRKPVTPGVAIMKTDVFESDEGYNLEIELPGYKKDALTLELKEGYLTVSATKKDEQNEEKKGQFIRRERFIGTSSRSFYVGDEVTEEDIKAKFEDGILYIFVPKKEALPEIPKSRFISIEG